MKRGGEGGLNQPLSNREKAKRALRAAVLGALAATAAPSPAGAAPLEKSITQPHTGDKIKLPPRDPRKRDAIKYLIEHGKIPPEKVPTQKPKVLAQLLRSTAPLPQPGSILPEEMAEPVEGSMAGVRADKALPFARIQPPIIPSSGVFTPKSREVRKQNVEKQQASLTPLQTEQEVKEKIAIPLPKERPPRADWRPETKELTHSREALVRSLVLSTHGYDGPRIEQENYRRLKPPGLSVRPQNNTFQRLHLHASLGRFSLAGTEEDMLLGKFERALRFKNISDSVEARYNLPPGLLLAMLIQESSGVDAFPNGRDDGGIGLIHMQPAAATEFGLRTHGNNRAIVDKAHGAALRALITEKNGNSFALSQDDERFNRTLNIDAVGRMLATHMSGKRIKGLGPLRTAFKRYTGRDNYDDYLDSVRELMGQLNDQKFLGTVAKRFDDRNRALIINGKYVGDKTSPFAAYLKTFWEENEKGFRLDAYRDLPRYKPKHSDTALRTYKNFFFEKKEEPTE